MNSKVPHWIWTGIAVVALAAAALMTVAIPLSLGFVVADLNDPLTYVFILLGLWVFAFAGLYMSRRYRNSVSSRGDVTNQRSVVMKRVTLTVLAVLVVILAVAIIDAVGGR